MHTGGHASPDLIRQVILAVNPREAVYPIHTEDAEGFRRLDLPPLLRDKIKVCC